MKKKKVIVPNIVAGGTAVPLGSNYYLMRGRKHEEGGIDVGANPRTGLEVEDGEVMQLKDKEVRVFSTVPFLNGQSPAQKVMGGENPNKVFAQQETYKDKNNINDDGTRKAKLGIKKDGNYVAEASSTKVAKPIITYDNNANFDLNKSLNIEPIFTDGNEEYNINVYNHEYIDRNDIKRFLHTLDNERPNEVITLNPDGEITMLYNLKDKNILPAGYNKNKKDIEKKLIEIRKDLDYIGGNEQDVAKTIFNRIPYVTNMVDSLSQIYNIPKNNFYERLSQEGYTTYIANMYNIAPKAFQRDYALKNYAINGAMDAFRFLGLDTAGEHLVKGHYNMRWKDPKLGYETIDVRNEKGKSQTSIYPSTSEAAFEIKAAHIEYLKNKMKEKYPNATDKEISNLINAAYNLGENHKLLNDMDYVNRRYNVTDWGNLLNNQKGYGGNHPLNTEYKQKQIIDMKDNNSRTKAKAGLRYILQTNGRNKLGYVPSTGESLSEAKGRDKAELGIFKKVANWVEENPNTTSDIASAVSNIGGGLTSYFINRDMLKDLNYDRKPIPRIAAKLKTNININPQLDKMRESLANYERNIDANTASSQVGLARKQKARANSLSGYNELYGYKENTETELINKDRLNQQEVANQSIADYNTYLEKKMAFDNAVREKQADNSVNLVNNLNKTFQGLITTGEKRKADKMNALAIMAANPNVNPRILREIGVTSITDEMVENWERINLKKGQ